MQVCAIPVSTVEQSVAYRHCLEGAGVPGCLFGKGLKKCVPGFLWLFTSKRVCQLRQFSLLGLVGMCRNLASLGRMKFDSSVVQVRHFRLIVSRSPLAAGASASPDRLQRWFGGKSRYSRDGGCCRRTFARRNGPIRESSRRQWWLGSRRCSLETIASAGFWVASVRISPWFKRWAWAGSSGR